MGISCYYINIYIPSEKLLKCMCTSSEEYCRNKIHNKIYLLFIEVRRNWMAAPPPLPQRRRWKLSTFATCRRCRRERLGASRTSSTRRSTPECSPSTSCSRARRPSTSTYCFTATARRQPPVAACLRPAATTRCSTAPRSSRSRDASTADGSALPVRRGQPRRHEIDVHIGR